MTYWFYASLIDPMNPELLIVEDIECELEISARVIGGEVETEITDVLVNGKSLTDGGKFAGQCRDIIKAQAEAEIRDGGSLWDRVREAEGISLAGLPGSPDAYWRSSAAW